MLIDGYRMEVGTSSHSADEFEYEVIAHLDVDISPAMPYLNAVLSRGVYLPKGPVLSWRHEGHNTGFWPDRIAVDHLHSRQEADEMVRRLVDLVNGVWERREQIVPDTSTHERLQPLMLYRLLPGTNCKRCGDTTCFALALKLAAGQASLSACAPLLDEPVWSEQRAQLEVLLATRWPTL